MHGTTTAILITAAALQASANPLFKRQVLSSSAPISSASASSNLTTSSFGPTPTYSSGLPIPSNTFPFPGHNGTYYLCDFDFPQTNDTATSSLASLSTDTISGALPLPTATVTASSLVISDAFVANATTSGSVATTSLLPSSPAVTPGPTPTSFTVVGPSSTMVIQCIQVQGGQHPHPPGPGPITSSGSLPPLPTLSVPPSSTRASASGLPTTTV